MLTNSDLRQIEERGSSKAVVAKQLESFRKGFPWMKIVGPATPERGILVLSEAEAKAACKYSDEASVAGRCKFVPASGAASRMCKDIFAGLSILEGGSDIVPDSPAARLCSSIEKFAFYSEALFGAPADSPAWRKDVLSKVLGEPGLGYGSKPKGVILFHRYPSEVRTAFAEHLVEAQEYMRNQDGSCNLMVTISPEHKPLFEKALADVKEAYEKRYGVRYNIVFTFQDKATDTIAADPTGKPFRTSEGKLLFRPAGHGALIHNLNAVEQELVSIKNIDNVACERFLPVTSLYKKVLMGKALELRDRIFAYLRRFDSLEPGTEAFHMLCNEVENFLDKELCVQLPLAVVRLSAPKSSAPNLTARSASAAWYATRASPAAAPSSSPAATAPLRSRSLRASRLTLRLPMSSPARPISTRSTSSAAFATTVAASLTS